ncbi:MAG TPA: hypothetical protein VGL77_15150 [Armatimonadota bacterium]
MELNTPQRSLGSLLTAIEITISDLYRLYADQNPELTAFWSRLARDEVRHSQWVGDLMLDMDAGLLHTLMNRDNVAVYREFLEFLTETLERDRATPISSSHALATASLIEKTYIERNLFAVFTTDSPELQRVLNALERETTHHFKMIEAMKARLHPEGA